MKKYFQALIYPLICFFSLILSLVVLAKMVGKYNIFFTMGNLFAKLHFVSLFIYVLLIVAGGYLLIKARSLAVCIVAGLIFLLSVCYLLRGESQFNLLIYYFLYALVLAALGVKQIRTSK